MKFLKKFYENNSGIIFYLIFKRLKINVSKKLVGIFGKMLNKRLVKFLNMFEIIGQYSGKF